MEKHHSIDESKEIVRESSFFKKFINMNARQKALQDQEEEKNPADAGGFLNIQVQPFEEQKPPRQQTTDSKSDTKISSLSIGKRQKSCEKTVLFDLQTTDSKATK